MKQFFRNFRRKKFIGTLNIITLAVGIMVSLTVGLWSVNELSFDNFHPDGDRIYRSIMEANINNTRQTVPLTQREYGRKAKADFPEVEDVCQVIFINHDYYVNRSATIDEVIYNDIAMVAVDRNFFTFFNFPLKEGDRDLAIASPGNIVISESAARKHFPGGAMGEKITVDDTDLFVSGIMYDMPANSHLHADVVFPFLGKRDEAYIDSFSTYLKVHEGADIGRLEAGLSSAAYEVADYYKSLEANMLLEPLADIHFSKHAMFDFAVKGDRQITFIFMITALVILIISCVNFINIFISTSFARAKGIGIMKSLGAQRGLLLRQLYGETFMYALFAVVIGVGLTILALPVFNNVVGSNISVRYDSPVIYIFCAILLAAITLLAGSFPALYMTRFGIMETLRSRFQPRKVSLLQKSLIVFQFTGSIFLLITVIFFGRQISYMINQDLGFDKENIIQVNAKGDFGSNYETLRTELMREPSITDVTMKSGSIIEWNSGSTIKADMHTDEILFEQCIVRENYFDFMGMEIVEGDNALIFDSSIEQNFCIINQRGAQLLGLEEPVDKTIIAWGNTPFTIKGIVRDAQVRSFHNLSDPQLYRRQWYDEWISSTFFFKVSGDPTDAIAAIKKSWEAAAPKQPFEYQFLDDSYRQLYQSEVNARKVLEYAWIITIIITVSGLFAMTYYSIQRRVKEIAIRKINGAGIKDLLLLLNRDITVWVLVSFVIATAISYFFLRNWLGGFVVKASLSPWVFIAAGSLTFAIALLTISGTVWRAANSNPVDSLNRE